MRSIISRMLRQGPLLNPAMPLALAVPSAGQALPFLITSLKSSPIIAQNATLCDDVNQCRTLWDIVWSCLFTMFLCTWVSVHPNIPGPHERWLKVVSRRLGIMLAVLIAPELTFSWALRQRILAGKLANEHKRHGWTNTHGFFAIMGGFMAFNGDRAVQTLLPSQLGDYSLTGTGDFPRITEEEIKDKSKGDVISKGLVVLQTGWFVLQCVARRAEGLPIAELELVTIAYAALSFAMFSMWWNKPLDVERSVRVYKKRGTDEASGEDHMADNESLNLEPTGSLWARFCRFAKALFTIPIKIAQHILAAIRKPAWQVMLVPVTLLIEIATGNPRIVEDGMRIATFYPETWSLNSEKSIMLSGTVAATVFGAIHCVAWQFTFPSNTEQFLWRFASLATTGLPIPFILLAGLYIKKPTNIFVVMLGVFLPIYVICRMSLLVLPFLSLRALSPDTYQSIHWVTLVPHL